MTGYKYSMRVEKEKSGAAAGMNLPISTKKAIEVCNMIRGKRVSDAKEMLNQVLAMKIAVPFKRFPGGLGHKKGDGMAAGRYPLKTCSEILGVIESAESNARFKGLDAENLELKHISTQKAGQQFHYGRQRRRKMKRSHVEVIVIEGKAKPREKKEEKEEKKGGKQEKKGATKPESEAKVVEETKPVDAKEEIKAAVEAAKVEKPVVVAKPVAEVEKKIAEKKDNQEVAKK